MMARIVFRSFRSYGLQARRHSETLKNSFLASKFKDSVYQRMHDTRCDEQQQGACVLRPRNLGIQSARGGGGLATRTHSSKN
jgi:hypothetical protein